MSTATTLKHWMHHGGHLPHWMGLWGALALVVLIAGLVALFALAIRNPTLMQHYYYEAPQFPVY